jgi:hypothetical protein
MGDEKQVNEHNRRVVSSAIKKNKAGYGSSTSGRLRQEDHEFQTSLGYIVSLKLA